MRSVPKIVHFVTDVFRHDAEIEVRDVLDLACRTGGPSIELAKKGV